MAAQTAEREEEFRAFVLGCQARLLRFAELVTGDRGHAEDLLQHGFAKSYAAWGRLRSASPEQYVRRCIINAHTDRWRRGNWRERSSAQLADQPVAGDHAAAVAERDAVLRALAALSASERAVVVLRYYSELTEAEIARELSMPAGTVKSTAARALTKLRANAGLVDTLNADKEAQR